MKRPPEKPGSHGSHWEEFKQFAFMLVFDLMKNLLVLISIAVFGLFITLLRTTGLSEDRLEMLEKVHFYIAVAALVIVGILFLLKLFQPLTPRKEK